MGSPTAIGRGRVELFSLQRTTLGRVIRWIEMAGKHRGPSPEVTKMIRLPTHSQVDNAVTYLAFLEQRSYGNMVHVLLTEALVARGILGNGKRPPTRS